MPPTIQFNLPSRLAERLGRLHHRQHRSRVPAARLSRTALFLVAVERGLELLEAEEDARPSLRRVRLGDPDFDDQVGPCIPMSAIDALDDAA